MGVDVGTLLIVPSIQKPDLMQRTSHLVGAVVQWCSIQQLMLPTRNTLVMHRPEATRQLRILQCAQTTVLVHSTTPGSKLIARHAEA
jgi:hypothetical protein